MTKRRTDELRMRDCLLLASKGAGRVSPNPMVGCVIVKEGRMIGNGYHRRFGGAHAEVNAIRSAGRSVRGATLYVNLEPCNFQGKTPPCTDLIIRSGIARVVAGMRDPNPRVSGSGIRQLRRAGVEVTCGVLEDQCRLLNEFFVTFITTGLPFVTLKVAQSLDGMIARKEGRSKQITGRVSRTQVHVLRALHDAVLVGAGTVKIDDPRLTVRLAAGRDPVRVVLDGRFTSSEGAALFAPRAGGETILVTHSGFLARQARKAGRLRRKGVVILGLPGPRGGKLSGNLSLKSVLRALGSRGIASLLVEGGASVFSSFVRERAFDKLLLFTAPEIFGEGTSAFRDLSSGVRLRRVSVTSLDGDTLTEGYLH